MIVSRAWRRCGPALGSALACAAIVAPVSGQGAPTLDLSGTVLDATTSRPVSMAEVILEEQRPGPDGDGPSGSEAGFRRSTRTDEGGNYRFHRIPPGSYRLAVVRMGYRRATVWLEMPTPGSVRRSVGLDVDPVRLEPVQLETAALLRPWSLNADADADRARPGSVRAAGDGAARRPTLDARTLTAEDVRHLSTMGEPDVLRSLQRLPGVSGRGDYSAELWTRGAPWGLTRILLDGLPLYEPVQVGGNRSALAADGLEAILLLPGVRPASMAEGAAGTVSLVSRTARSDADAVVAVSSLAVRARWQDRWLDDRIGLSVTGRRSWWDLIDPPRILTGEPSSGPIDYYVADATIRLDARLAGDVVLEAGAFREEDRIDGDVRDLVADSKGRWGNHLEWAALGRSWEDVRFRALVGRTAHVSRTRSNPWSFFFSPEGVPTLDPMELDIARTLLRLEAGGRIAEGAVEWEAGWDRARETLRQRSMTARDRRAPGVNGPAVAGWSRGWAQVEAHSGIASLSAGLAWDIPHEGDPQGLGPLPNARLRLRPTDFLVLEAARGRSIQTAYPSARAGRTFGPALGAGHVWVLAGRDVPPLASDIATLGAELELPRGFGIGGTAWRRLITGFETAGVGIVREGGVVPWDPEAGTGREAGHGMEVSLWRREGRVTGEVSYTLIRSEFAGPEGDTWASPAERRHSLNAVVSGWVARGIRAVAIVRDESGWPYVLGPWACPELGECDIQPGDPLRPAEHSFLRAPTYQVVDVLTDWERRGKRIGWGLTLSVRNVLGRDNASAFRPDGCSGAGLFSTVCHQAVGVGRFAPGLSGPAPGIALRVLF